MTDIICDIDGTLMNVEARRKLAVSQKRDSDKVMNWDVFLDPQNMFMLDTPQPDVVMVIKALYSDYNNIIFTSARNERHRDVTMIQIADCLNLDTLDPSTKLSKFECGHRPILFLRADDDFRPDDIVKKELLGDIKQRGFNPTLAFDDRDQVVKMWRGLGIECFQVREGDF